MLALEGVAKRFGGLQVLRDVTFRVDDGEIVGLIGPNGAGKSTLFNLICGLLHADSGRITLRDRRIERLPAHQICRLGLTKTSQIVRVFSHMTAAENALIGALLRARSVEDARRRALEALEQVGMRGYGDRQAADLVLVDRMRLELARALCTAPALLLVDELMAGLNMAEVEAMVGVLRGLRERGMTIVVIEHNMKALMRLCDRVLALDAGVIVAEGKAEAVSRDPRVIESYLGEKFAHAIDR